MQVAPPGPLRRRPPEPLYPATAIAEVGRRLTQLDDPAAHALALVQLAGRSREQAAAELELGGEEFAAALARARKALRRSLSPLPGSGWCERAERMLSDDMDGALEPPGPARLDVHLRNCARCVEHQRLLADALERLTVEARPAPAPEPEPDAAPEPASESEVEPQAERAPEPPREAEPEAAREQEAAQEEEPAPEAEAELEPEPAPAPRLEPEPAPAPRLEPEAVAPPPPTRAETPEASPIAQPLQRAVWNTLFVVAVALAVASLVLTAVGITEAL
jgi:Putative zinc-finger